MLNLTTDSAQICWSETKQGNMGEQQSKETIQVVFKPPEFAIPKRYEPRHHAASTSDEPDVIGSINASLYQGSQAQLGQDSISKTPPLGTISFKVLYESWEQNLLINILDANQLPPRHLVDNKGGTSDYDVKICDPYVMICLLPNEKDVRTTSIKKDTHEPVFDECFKFKVAPNDLKDKTIRLTVYDESRNNHATPIGHALYSLKGLQPKDWCNVQRNLQFHSQPFGHDRGQISIALTINLTMEKLTLGIIRARNLTKMGSFRGHPDYHYYVKVSQIIGNQRTRHRRTSMQECKQRDPVFGDSMTFGLPVIHLADCTVVVSLMSHSRVKKDLLIGQVELGPYVFSRNNERTHWGLMIDTPMKEIVQWHTLFI